MTSTIDIKIFVRLLVIGISSLAIYFSIITNPTYSYDMIGYVASAYTEDGYSGEELRNKTVQDIKSTLPEKKYNAYLQASDFWSAVLSDSKSLQQILHFVSMRVVYIDLMRFVHIFDVSYTKASVQVSAIFGGLTVLVLALIIVKIDLPIAMLPLVIFVTNLLGVASLPSPDILACCFALLAIYMLMIGSRLIYPIAALMPLVRTDLVILTGILMLYLFYIEKSKHKLAMILSMACSIVAYVAVNKIHGFYGMLNLYNNMHIHPTIYPADIVMSTKIGDYVLPYVWLIRDTLSDSHAVFYMVGISILIYSKKIGYDIKYKYPLFIIPLAYVLIHIVTYPCYFDRFFIFSILLIMLGIMHFLKYQLKNLAASGAKNGTTNIDLSQRL